MQAQPATIQCGQCRTMFGIPAGYQQAQCPSCSTVNALPMQQQQQQQQPQQHVIVQQQSGYDPSKCVCGGMKGPPQWTGITWLLCLCLFPFNFCCCVPTEVRCMNCGRVFQGPDESACCAHP
jgi:LSD1 subclass zinc finger protein